MAATAASPATLNENATPKTADRTSIIPAHRVTVSCLLSDIRHGWTLSPAPGGCRVQVHVEIPEAEAERLEAVREEVRASLPRLLAVAERGAGPRP